MKKSLLTLLGAGLLLTSCQSDEPFAPVEGGEKQVTFTLNVPGELGTRAASGESGAQNNQNANIYYTLVLDANGDKRVLQETTTEKTVTFTTPVVLGRKYDITAYASYTNNIDANASNIKAIPVEKSFNDETKDAYTAHVEDHDFALNALPAMQLKRPFGKLRLIATDYVETGEAKNTKIDQVTVTYDNTTVTTYDATTAFFNKVGTGISDTKEFNQYYTDNTDGMPIFADYLPANGEGQDNPITFTVTVRYAESTETYSRTFNDIPVRRNALTTLKGAFFTANSEIKVEVKDAFEGQIPGNDEEQLIIAAAMGGAYTLQGDIELSKPLNITTNMTLNLNGNTLTAANEKGNGAVIEVAEGVSAKLMGGTIKNTTPNGDAAINNAGELVLEDITINGAPLADGGYSAYAVISSGKLTIEDGVNVSADRGCLKFSGAGETVINGGNFKNNDIGSKTLTSHVVDVEDGGTHKLTINGGTFAHHHTATSGGVVICNRTRGTVYVNGGNFSGGNYYGNNNLSDYGYGGTFVVTGGTYSAKPAAKYIAAGYKAIEMDGKWVVVATANDAASLATAVAKGGVIVLDENIAQIDINEAIVIPTGVTATLDLNGKTVNAPSSSAFVAKEGAELTIKNGKVVAYESTVSARGGKIIVESGEYTSTGTALDTPATYRYSLDCREGGELVVNGGTFKSNNGMINVGSTVTINGGKFENVVEKTMTRHFAYVLAPLTINDGEFYGKANSGAGGCFFCGAASTGNVTVNGGKFTSLWNSGSKNNIWESYYGGSIEINGGIFNYNGGIKNQVIENTDAATKDAYPYMAM